MSSHSFKIGDRARIVRDNSGRYGWTVGRECTIESALRPYISREGKRFEVHEIKIIGFDMPPESYLVCEPDELEPIQKDPGREKVSWDECPWKPEHLREKCDHEHLRKERETA